MFAAAQSLIVSLCLFLAYRLVIGHAGLEQLGVLSLLFAATAFVRIGDVSGAASLARFVAMRAPDGETHAASEIVHTVLLTSFAFNGGLGFAIWIFAPVAIPSFIPPRLLTESHMLLPWVVATMVLGSIAVAVTSAIDGTQRADQRAIVVTASAVIFLVACWILVPRFGVIGYGASQVVQQASISVFGWITLRRHIEGLGWLPFRWRKDLFIKTTGYALRLNATGVAALMFEPLAKFAINGAEGPALVALYELASRLIVQIRGMVISAAAPIVPAFAALPGPDAPQFRKMLTKGVKIVSVASVGVCVLTFLAAPIVSIIVLGFVSKKMLYLNAALNMSWSIQMNCLPFYMAGQAFGILRWNFISHAFIAVSVATCALLLVPSFGLTAAVAAIVVGLLGSLFPSLLGNAYSMRALDILHSLRWWIVGSTVTTLLTYAFAIFAISSIS
ncbi:polysaccharide biosynthesis C-terminal domain-containing protein [Mesorhizobium sp. ISC15]|uniref:polysaccharide biosynthesis C-terminal domain-containing protein n=1 Tax=Mesorhizobium sp. ISC15 TaxID=3076429 RepID=UPI00301B7AE3